MAPNFIHTRPTLGVLAGWQFAWTATPFSYLDPIFQGICLAARDLGCNVLLGCGMGGWAAEQGALRTAWPLISPESDFVPVGPWNTDGLMVINPLHSELRSRYLQDLRAAGHPLIFIGSGEAGPTIVADNRSGIFEALRHLVAHGHHRIAFIAGSRDDLEGDSGERLQAYYDGVLEHGLAADPRLIVWGQHTYARGYDAMHEILESGAPFSAVIASNDESALGAMQALQERGLRIPQDVALIGFDDRPESAVQTPPLSSVRIPLRKLGYRAVEVLWRYLTGRAETLESDVVPITLMLRESCGCGAHVVLSSSARRIEAPVCLSTREALVQAMTEVLLVEAQGLARDDLEALCLRLVQAFYLSCAQEDATIFHAALESILQQVRLSGDEAHSWQAALSCMESALDAPTETLPPHARTRARALLAGARVVISANIQRQYLQRQVQQHWTLYQLSTLTTRLLTAHNATQVYDILAQHLPTMGISLAWIALFEDEGAGATAQATLNVIVPLTPGQTQPALHFHSHEFPPNSLSPTERPFSLALFPLTSPRGQLGFVVFDTAQLDLYSAIAQQLVTALHSAQLYSEATEGRRLAEQANELKSRFLSTVSHELRTPLNLIVGLSGMLLQADDEGNTSAPASYRKDIEQISANAQHLGGLIGDVLDLASSDAGQLRLNYAYVDVGATLRMVAETGRQMAEAKGLDWNTRLPDTGPWVWGDRTRLRQVVLNLIDNAVKFTAQGQVFLGLESTADTVTVTVRDTGLGIPTVEQDEIFGEFRRSERSRVRGYRGLGLGLAICKRLVEMHGGVIGVHSTGEEGSGSVFYFTLPVVEPPVSPAGGVLSGSPISAGVLIITHRMGNGAQLQTHLTSQGLDAHLVFCDENPDWFTQLMAFPPLAIVIDVSNAPQQGWRVFRAIKSYPQTQHLPVLFYALSQDSGAVLEFDYLTKPIEVTELARALDQQALAPDAAGSPALAAKTVLVVDDDPATLELHARVVAQAHAASNRVLKAQNGREALEILGQEAVDLVLLDLMMPQIDGFGVLRTMRAHDALRRIPVIVLTGQTLTESEMAQLDQGVATVLSKGVFSLEETLAHIDATLERHRKLGEETQRLVRHAMAYIHEHYAEPISRASLARYIAFSEDYLTYCFRKELGVTPITYLNRFRVNQARQLLLETTKSITEIALDVGFSDSGYFSRVFRREVGMSPEAYRQS
ncbi:MAG: substrate-binding domain-containing protein [Anaerolineae bacterium]|nr:substrate-binding domain-containing protein [Anaerolineae bacterium]